MTAYEQGFFTKCAEYGIAPEWLVKEAARLDYGLKAALRVIKNSGKLGVLIQDAAKMGTKSQTARLKAMESLMRANPEKYGLGKSAPMMFGKGVFGHGPSELIAKYSRIYPRLESTAGKSRAEIMDSIRTGMLADGDRTLANVSRPRRSRMEAVWGSPRPVISKVEGKIPPKMTAEQIRNIAENSTAKLPPRTYPVGAPSASGAADTARAVENAVANSGAGSFAAPNAGAIPTPEGRGFFSRWMNLLRGGDRERLAGELADYKAGSKEFLERLQTIADGTYDKAQSAELYKALDRSRLNTEAETARRLQNLNSETNKVLATRIGTGVVGAGALGIPIAAASEPDTYTSNDPWHRLNI